MCTNPNPVSYTHLDVYKRQVFIVSDRIKRLIIDFLAVNERMRKIRMKGKCFSY